MGADPGELVARVGPEAPRGCEVLELVEDDLRQGGAVRLEERDAGEPAGHLGGDPRCQIPAQAVPGDEDPPGVDARAARAMVDAVLAEAPEGRDLTRGAVTTLLGEMQSEGLLKIRRQRLVLLDMNRMDAGRNGAAAGVKNRVDTPQPSSPLRGVEVRPFSEP